MQLPDDYRTHETKISPALFVSAAARAGDPFCPFGVSFAMELEDGTRVAAIMRDRDQVIRLVETVLAKAQLVWPETEEGGGVER